MKTLLLFLAACTSTVSRQDAALEISEAACDRAQTCGNLGGESVADCASVNFTSFCDQPPGCAGNVDVKLLDSCLDEIGMMPCADQYLPVDCYEALTP